MTGSENDNFNNDGVLAIDKSNDSLSTESMDLYSRDNNALEGITAINRFKGDIRHYNTICYKDICLLVIYSPGSREQNILIIEIIIAYYKGYKRCPKP
jgi:hypothetical protein